MLLIFSSIFVIAVAVIIIGRQVFLMEDRIIRNEKDFEELKNKLLNGILK